MHTNLEQLINEIRALSLEDFYKLRAVIDIGENNRSIKGKAAINYNRKLEILRKFHDDFYNEEKDGFTQSELRDALRWILVNYEEQQRNKDGNSFSRQG